MEIEDEVGIRESENTCEEDQHEDFDVTEHFYDHSDEEGSGLEDSHEVEEFEPDEEDCEAANHKLVVAQVEIEEDNAAES